MPDLNSVPLSPHSLASSRRQSAHMAPLHPPAPPTAASASTPTPTPPSLNILPSNQSAVTQGSGHHSSALPSPQLTASQAAQPQPAGGEVGVGSGPGPLRHPRPLTASELHMQLEKEQEAVVNRLTRELTLLRAAQNASVVSNTSSTSASASIHDPIAEPSLLSGSGFSIPTTRRHHRTSSAASHSAQLASSFESRSHAPRPQAIPLSRQDSAQSRRSQNNSPAPSHSLDPSNYFHSQRIPLPASFHMSSVGATPGSGSATDQLSPGLMPGTMRYEETAYYRNELEAAKKENDALKRRIRELERTVRDRRDRRASDASRTRSESVSTTASMSVAPVVGASIAGPRDGGAAQVQERERRLNRQSIASVAGSVGVGVPDEELKVGESAASAGLGNSRP